MSLIYFVLSNVRLAWNFHEPWCDATPSPTRTEFYCLRKSTNFSNCGSSVGGLKRWTGGALWCFRQPTFVCVTKIHIFMMFLNWSNQVEWQLLLHLFFLVVFFFFWHHRHFKCWFMGSRSQGSSFDRWNSLCLSIIRKTEEKRKRTERAETQTVVHRRIFPQMKRYVAGVCVLRESWLGIS